VHGNLSELASKYPMSAKVLALQLPMKTIKDFIDWAMQHYPTWELDRVFEHLDELLYEYYKVDTKALAAEMEAAGTR
jgi:hypothetical protein